MILGAQDLDPVAARLLSDARRDAATVRRAALAEAEATTAGAREQAGAVLAEARARGADEAEALARAERARARRRAREMILTAKGEAYAELRRQARAAARALGEDPELIARLTELARARAGTGATVVRQPGDGVIAEAAGRRVDATLDTLADHAVDALGAEVESLWAS